MDSQNKSILPDVILFAIFFVCSMIIVSVLYYYSNRLKMESLNESRNTTTISLPEEIIEEILSRLPVKSLLKFKCVSKPWRYIICSNHFINKQLQDSKHQRALFCSIIKGEVWHCSLLSLFDKPGIPALESNVATNFGLVSLLLVGCCNGLVCILLNCNQFVLWNPSTRISKKLPRLRITPRYIRNYGFGYDESSGDYKVIVIFDGEHPTVCEIYSFKTDSWKEIMNACDEASFCLCNWKWMSTRGKLAGGKLHWVMDKKWEIVGFDLKREVFEMVEQPSLSDGCYHQYLGILGVCLSLIRLLKSCYEFWVMKEYGVKESWEKLMEIDGENNSSVWTSPSFSSFGIQRQGEILVIITRRLLIYDRKFKKFHPISLVSGESDIYVESLVSP